MPDKLQTWRIIQRIISFSCGLKFGAELKSGSFSRSKLRDISQQLSLHGQQLFVRADNVAEFVAHRVETWLTTNDVEATFRRAWEAVAEQDERELYWKRRDECLTIEWFMTWVEAKTVIEHWRHYLNEESPLQLELLPASASTSIYQSVRILSS
jgi:hypothetical protein